MFINNLTLKCVQYFQTRRWGWWRIQATATATATATRSRRRRSSSRSSRSTVLYLYGMSKRHNPFAMRPRLRVFHMCSPSRSHRDWRWTRRHLSLPRLSDTGNFATSPFLRLKKLTGNAFLPIFYIIPIISYIISFFNKKYHYRSWNYKLTCDK